MSRTKGQRALFFGILLSGGWWLLSHDGWADDAHVAIRKVNGRTEAVVTVPGAMLEEPAEEKGSMEETIAAVEDGAIEVMGTSNEIVGRGTDHAVRTVQSVGDSAFSWFFHMLDAFKGGSEESTT